MDEQYNRNNTLYYQSFTRFRRLSGFCATHLLVRRVGFIAKPEKLEALDLLRSLSSWVIRSGRTAVLTEAVETLEDGVVVVPEQDLGTEVDIIVSLGGDGTMLRASAAVADHGVPVLGINLGRLGFLTQFSPDEAQSTLATALAGNLSTDERMRLEVVLTSPHQAQVVRSAVNDVVVHQGNMARLIELDALLNDELITSYRADGLIVATPTGSTAYNLAAGGPILTPGQQAMALTPICAHSLTNRPLVVPKNATISLQLRDESRGAVVTVDGQWAHELHADEQVSIRAAARPLVLFVSPKGYFTMLREKLHWGASLAPNRS